MGNRYYYERGDTYDERDDGLPLCPECESAMSLIVATDDPLYQCPECKLEQYESAIAAFWEHEVHDKNEAQRERPEFPVYVDAQGNEHGEF